MKTLQKVTKNALEMGKKDQLSVKINCKKFISVLRDEVRGIDADVSYYLAAGRYSEKGLDNKPNIHILPKAIQACLDKHSDKIDMIFKDFGSYDYYFDNLPCDSDRVSLIKGVERVILNVNYAFDELLDLAERIEDDYGMDPSDLEDCLLTVE